MALGLLLSAFARTEFQAVQFMPAFVFPQILLCGLIVPRDQMARALEIVVLRSFRSPMPTTRCIGSATTSSTRAWRWT